ncbi:hypothetical protein H5410_021672 [Solanum commersonii]|uniref:NADH-ubiquinone oxidoreductase chain 4 n=1 Tax=Solanum commersonii TaxID=4109 RepID=A0A9J5ZEL9_SOLCO|nr:hypothetical protein H5410_021672 [Solanum commersonii]
MPNLSTIFFFSSLANLSSRSTSSFIGKFLILVGAFQINSLVAMLAVVGMILGAVYSLWLYNLAVCGNLKPNFLHKFFDPNDREVSIYIPFLVGGANRRLNPSSERIVELQFDEYGFSGTKWVTSNRFIALAQNTINPA